MATGSLERSEGCRPWKVARGMPPKTWPLPPTAPKRGRKAIQSYEVSEERVMQSWALDHEHEIASSVEREAIFVSSVFV